MFAASLLAASLLAQTPTAAEERAAVAAEQAAAAAKSAAEAAQKAAEALEKLAELEAKEQAAEAAAAPVAAAAAPAPAAKPSLWTGGLGLGFTYLTGNANSITFTGNANIQRKSDRWIYGAKAWGAYGLTTAADSSTPQVVALNAGILGQVDLRLVQMVSILIAGGVDTDHVKSVELRGYGEVGVGVMWVDQKVEDYQKLMLKTDVTFRAGSEGRYNYYPKAAVPCEGPLPGTRGPDVAFPEGADRDANGDYTIDLPSCASSAGGGGNVLILAPRLAASFKYSLTKAIFFTDDLELFPTVAGTAAGRFQLNNTAKVSIRPVAAFGVSAAWTINLDTQPAAGKVPFDSAVIGGIDVAF